ncbi:hypothetical protein GSI_04526 [Ganoderma sinense ZZ0214-1]|uniref:Uncharacterized protein n=1 Tax=Ganoderma sinense ZZ0214-1 TaxID=1077348 RepID=A0A2G8SH95_9APHY|nr:hypothetical protein GSI_04526 [Ganoderma sinense ZZ0214-1]
MSAGSGLLPFAANTLLTTLSSHRPTADGTEVGEPSISDMRACSAGKSGEHQPHSLAFGPIQNILAPVNGLPPEILSRILIEAWQDRRSLRLTHVCRLWRSILLETSEFWAVAVAGDQFRLPTSNEESSDQDYLFVACLRSAPRDLSLNLWSISPRCRLQLIQEAHRITSMHISVQTREQLELLWNVLYTGMQRLEDLSIRGSDSVTSWPGHWKLSTQELPRLTQLTLPARLFRPSWPNTLQTLALRSHHGNDGTAPLHAVSLDVVLVSLVNHSSLRVLDIRDNTLFDNPGPSRVFPGLELLRVRSGWRTVSTMLSLLAFPSSTRLRIGVVPPLVFPLGEFVAPGSALEAVVALLDRVAITGGPTSTIRGFASTSTTSTSDGSERLRLTTSFDERRTLRLFERVDPPVSHLLLAQHPAQRMPPMFMDQTIFRTFRHLTHLALHGRIGVCAELLSMLRPPTTPPDGPVLLPLLKDLTVGVATQRRSEISTALRRGDLAYEPDGGTGVTMHFGECCRLFPGVLDARRERGYQYRLSRLEFFSYEEGCMAKADSEDPVVSHVDLAAYEGNLVECELAPLRALVDGPVVFSGYRFFTDVRDDLRR